MSAKLDDELEGPHSSHYFCSNVGAVTHDTSTTNDGTSYIPIRRKYRYSHAPFALATAPVTADLYDLEVIVNYWCGDKDIGGGIGILYGFVSHREKAKGLTYL